MLSTARVYPAILRKRCLQRQRSSPHSVQGLQGGRTQTSVISARSRSCQTQLSAFPEKAYRRTLRDAFMGEWFKVSFGG